MFFNFPFPTTCLFSTSGVSYMFDTDGRRITSLEQIKDGGVYVCSASRKFVPGNYGAFGDAFYAENYKESVARAHDRTDFPNARQPDTSRYTKPYIVNKCK